MDKSELLKKINISTYHGTFIEENAPAEVKQYMAAYGSNKAQVVAKTKRLAKAYSKENLNKNILWKVFLNTVMKDIIDKGCYNSGKIIKDK